MIRLIIALCCIGLLLSASVATGFNWTGTTEIIRSVQLTPDGKLEVVRTRGTGITYLEGGEPPHYAYRDIYGAKNGEIILEKTIEGQYIPESTQRIPAQFIWSR